jgi:hypothetical protein
MDMTGRNRLAVLTLGGLFACSSGSGGGNGMPIDDLVTEAAAADCATAVRCHFVSDAALCMAVYGPLLARQLFNDFGAAVASAKAGKAHYDGAAARACLDATKNKDCAATSTPAVCDQVFTGTVPNGARCINDVVCVPGSFCARPTSDTAPCDGTCTPADTLCNKDSQCTGGRVCDWSMSTVTSMGTCANPVAPGAAEQSCGTNNGCAPGLYCSSTSVCTAPAHAGEPCNGARNGFPCADALLCVRSADGTSSTCMAAAAKGEACATTGQCGGPLTSLGCDPTSHVCVDLPSSGACLGTGIFSCNPLTAFCDQAMATPSCQPFASKGASCSTNNIGQCGTVLVSPGPSCESPATGTGTCTAPPGPAACVP